MEPCPNGTRHVMLIIDVYAHVKFKTEDGKKNKWKKKCGDIASVTILD